MFQLTNVKFSYNDENAQKLTVQWLVLVNDLNFKF